MKITNDILYVGVNDHKVDLFEGQYKVPNGMCYNSYLILDEKVAVMDTVDQHFTHEWLDNLENALDGRKPDYLIVQHMEPDHSANIDSFLKTYPAATVVATAKAFAMMDNFFGPDLVKNRQVAENGGTLTLGRHTLTFVFAPMVHWPEVMVTYDSADKVLFSADAFGKFGALDRSEPWDDEARRYYIGIVGKYGAQAMNLLKKAAGLDIAVICPLHGPVLDKDLGHYIKLYQTWASYSVESEGIVVAYTSVYGHTRKAVELLADKLRQGGCPKVVVHDLARTDMSLAVSDAFRYGKLVLATTTYNADIYPFMREFIDHLTERNFQNRTVAFIENGSWAPMAYKVMKEKLSGCKNLTFADTAVHIKSAMNAANKEEIDALAAELCKNYQALSSETANKNDMTALFKIGYGLYVVTSNDGKKDNGLIVNTVAQVTSQPNRIAVTINHHEPQHPFRGGPLLRLRELRLPVRPDRGQVRRRGADPDGQRPCNAEKIRERRHVPEGDPVHRPRHPRHVHLRRDRGPGHQQRPLHDLRLLPRPCEAQTRHRREEGLRVQDLRLRLRGRDPARRFCLPAVQAWRGGF